VRTLHISRPNLDMSGQQPQLQPDALSTSELITHLRDCLNMIVIAMQWVVLWNQQLLTRRARI
jgi:hypothetical protein